MQLIAPRIFFSTRVGRTLEKPGQRVRSAKVSALRLSRGLAMLQSLALTLSWFRSCQKTRRMASFFNIARLIVSAIPDDISERHDARTG